MPPVRKPRVVKDKDWLQAVRWLPCWVRNQDPMHRCADTIGKGPSECSHLDTKSRDDRVIPLCGAAHRTGKHSWHAGQKSFCAYYRTTKDELIAEAERLYAIYKEGQ